MAKMKTETARKRITGGTQHRELPIIDLRALNEESRSVDVAFSSEQEVERWFGIEILDHSPRSIRMERMRTGAPLLLNHDPNRQIGVVRSADVDGDRKARANVEFSNSSLGEEIWRDVRDGIRQKMSVGYRIHDYDDSESRNGVDVYRVTDWEPYEISIVAVPADDSVGVGRAADQQETKSGEIQMKEDKTAARHEERQEEIGQSPNQQPNEVEATVAETPEEVRAAVKPTPDHDRMRSIGRRFGLEKMADDYIELGRGLDEFQQAVWAAKRAELRPVPSVVEPRIEMRPARRSRLKAFSNDSTGEEQAYRAGMWARSVLFGDQNAMRWCKDYGVRVMTGTTSGTSSVVPEEMVLPIIDLRERYGIARRYCYVHPMSSDTATVPRRKSGVTAYFVGRTTATTASDAAFDDVNLVAREVAALTRMSRSYADDAVINLADHLADEMAYAFAVKEDDCLFNGDGSSTYGGIYGIRPKIIDGNHTAGAVDAASGHDTFAEIDNDDLVGLTGALPMFPGIMAKWYISKRGNALVFDALKAAAGGNNIVDMAGRPASAYLGDEIVISQSMPTVTTDLSDVAMIVYGDLNMGAIFGDRMGFEVEILRERYAEYRQIGVQAVERFDIVVHGLGDTSDAGPIVALIGE